MTVIRISTSKLKNNLDKLKAKTNAELMAVLKCNGYGMGIVKYAETLSSMGVNRFAVSRPQEALELRKSGFSKPITLLTSSFDADVIKTLFDNDIEMAVSGFSHADIIKNALLNSYTQAKVHLALDTGMHRYGFAPDDVSALKPEDVPFDITGTFTHFFAAADEKLSKKQHDIFMNSLAKLQKIGINTGLIHCCASSAFLKYPEYHHDMVRLGSALVGTYEGLERIWRFETDATSIRQISKGSPIGYGGWKVKKNAEVATLPVGFSDGIMLERFEPVDFFGALRRFAKDILRPSFPISVYYNDVKVPIMGGAGTTHISVDVSGLPVHEGDTFVIESNPTLFSSDIERIYEK